MNCRLTWGVGRTAGQSFAALFCLDCMAPIRNRLTPGAARELRDALLEEGMLCRRQHALPAPVPAALTTTHDIEAEEEGMLTEIEWERTTERQKATYLESDAEDRAFWLEVWERTRRGLRETADAWERLRNASAKEIAEQRRNAERYTELLEWCRNQDAPVQPGLLLEDAE